MRGMAMTLWSRWRHKATTQDRELNLELQDLSARLADDYRARGVPDDEAHRRAALDVGGIPQTLERCRDVRRFSGFADVWRDLRLAARALRRSPNFTAAAIATLATGVATAAVVFGLVDAVLLRPLLYPEPERLLALTSSTTYTNSAQSGSIFHYLLSRSQAFESVASAGASMGWNLVIGDRAVYVRGLPVSHAYFDVLGVQPLVGRAIGLEEDLSNGADVVVISHQLAKDHFGDVSEAPGRVVRLGGRAATIVGVMPATFESVPAADIWTPLRASPTDRSINSTVIGRLRAGTSANQAVAELDLLRPRMVQDLQDSAGAFPQRLQQLTWAPFQAVVTGDRRPTLQLLSIAAVFVLLIACANLASLHVVRATARRQEIGVRVALGASVGRVIGHLGAESLLIGLGASVLGSSIAYAATKLLAPSISQGIVQAGTVSVDARTMAVIVAIAVVSSMLAGLWPAWIAARMHRCGGMRSSVAQPSDSGTSRTVRRGFVLIQVAMATMLLIGAGLTVRLLMRMSESELGFEPSGVLTAQMSLQGREAPDADVLSRLSTQILDRLRALPTVESAAFGSQVPVERGLNVPIAPTGIVRDMRTVDWRYVSPDYFETLKIPVLVGRAFDAQDHRSGPPVAIVNAAFAREFFGGPQQAVGRVTQLAPMVSDTPREIVGVVGDSRAASTAGRYRGHPLVAPPPPMMFVPVGQVPDGALALAHRFFPVRWIVRVSGGRTSVERAAQEALQRQVPTIPVVRWQWMPDLIEESKGSSRVMRSVLVLFASLGLLLAAIGLYGLAAYSVAVRAREFGIRRALGATATMVLRSVLGDQIKLCLTGVVVGLAGAAVLSRALATTLVGFDALDALVYATVLVVVVAASGLVACLPSIRAIRITPMAALREE